MTNPKLVRRLKRIRAKRIGDTFFYYPTILTKVNELNVGQGVILKRILGPALVEVEYRRIVNGTRETATKQVLVRDLSVNS